MSDAEYVKTACQHCAGPIEFPKSSVGVLENCPHCGKETRLGGTVGLSTTAKLLIVVYILLVFGGFGAALYFYRNSPASKPAAPIVQVPKATAKPVELNRFRVTDMAIEKSNEGGLMYAVGTLSNLTAEQRFGVKVELDLRDESGTKIGAANDYVDLVEPNASWNFRALVTDKRATKAAVRDISEK